MKDRTLRGGIPRSKHEVIHQWLRKNFKLGVCFIPKCKETWRLEWALLNGKEYEKKRENFIPLCRQHHIDYDRHLRHWKETEESKIIKDIVDNFFA